MIVKEKDISYIQSFTYKRVFCVLNMLLIVMITILSTNS